MGYFSYTVLTLLTASVLHSRQTQAADIALRLESGNRNGRISVIDEPQGYLISHWSYDRLNYPRDIDSSITLSGLQANQQVVIKFSAFGMYRIGVNSCTKDYLLITGSQSSRRFCGAQGWSPSLTRDITLTVRLNQIKFQFVTNITPGTGGNGFKLKYDVMPAPTTTSTSTKSSVSEQMANSSYGDSSESKGTGKGKPLAIGLGIGAAVLILIIVAVVAFLVMRKRKTRQNKRSSPAGDDCCVADYSYQKNNGSNNYQLAYEVTNPYQTQQVSEGDTDGSGYVRGVVTSDQSDSDKNVVEMVDNELYG